ncbi:MAG: hypothetical protein FWD76_06170 [Firmicutes bacterium]|nr:hypothetical protein [Bacillota bacterium]
MTKLCSICIGGILILLCGMAVVFAFFGQTVASLCLIGSIWIVECPFSVVRGERRGKMGMRGRLYLGILQFVTLALFFIAYGFASVWQDWFIWILLGEMSLAILWMLMLYVCRRSQSKQKSVPNKPNQSI